MPKRMLVIAERFPPDVGGLARSGARIAGALSRLCDEIDVLAWTRTLPPGVLETSPAGDADPSASGATLHLLGLYANQDLSLMHTQNVLEWLQSERRYDAVWGHYLFPAGFVATFFGGLSGIPAAVSARGNDVDRLMFPPGDFARLQWTLEQADVLTAVSENLAAKMKVLTGRRAALAPGARGPREVEIVHNAVRPELFFPGEPSRGLRERLGIADEEAVLAFSGELRHKKGFPFLLEALSEVRRVRPACLLVIGEARPREREHIAEFESHDRDAARRIIITGQLDDPNDVALHLRLADVFLMPSLWDGLPNALLEAMATGCVVLASDAGGMPEVIEHGESGFVVPRAQLHRLGEAIRELLSLSHERRAEIGRAARERVRSEFSPESEADALRTVLSRLDEAAAPASRR